MTKYAKYFSLAALAVAVVAGSSCSREEDEIWGQQASERLDAANNEYYNLLTSATDGWEMLYFANSGERGYNFLMKFESDSVVVAARNANTGNRYVTETSAFDLISDDGPVLTFNTYNAIFHRYSDPQSDGVGSGGDYEFKVMSSGDDHIYMRGKKTGIDIYLYRLEAGTDWEQYFDDIYAQRDRMFNSSIPTLWLQLADGQRYSITESASQVMKLVPEGGDALSMTTTLSCVLTRNGFRWCRNFPGDTVTATPAREFVWNAEGTYLESTDFSSNGEAVAGATLKAPALGDLFVGSTTWRIDFENMGGQFVEMYEQLCEELAAANRNWRVNYIQFMPYIQNNSNYATLLRVGTSNCYYYSDETVNSDGTVSITYNGLSNSAGNTLKNRVSFIQTFLDFISSQSYMLSASSELTPSYIRFESTTNSSDYFYVELQ